MRLDEVGKKPVVSLFSRRERGLHALQNGRRAGWLQAQVCFLECSLARKNRTAGGEMLFYPRPAVRGGHMFSDCLLQTLPQKKKIFGKEFLSWRVNFPERDFARRARPC